MEVDDDNIDFGKPEIVRDEGEMETISLLANDIFYHPARCLPEEMHAVEQLVTKIKRPVPESMCTLDDMYSLFIYSTLHFFISEGFYVFPVDGRRTNYPKNEVPDDWTNVIVRSLINLDPTAEDDKFTEFRLLMRNRLYVARFLLRVVPQEVEIYLSPYSDDRNLINDLKDQCVTLDAEIAKFFILNDRWQHFGFYLRYNMKKVYSAKRIRRAQGHSSQFASRANAPDLSNMST